MLITDKESFARLKRLNQLALTDKEDADTLAFFAARNADFSAMEAVDTENVQPMVHVMPMVTVVREDKEIKLFTRDELQASAPEAYEGYWQVPRLVE